KKKYKLAKKKAKQLKGCGRISDTRAIMKKGFAARVKRKEAEAKENKKKKKKTSAPPTTPVSQAARVKPTPHRRQIRRGRDRHSKIGCTLRHNGLSADSLKRFSWLKDGFISVTDLDERSPSQKQKLQDLIKELYDNAAAVPKGPNFVARKVPLTLK